MTLTGLEMKMIRKVLVDICFSWEIQPSLGCQKSSRYIVILLTCKPKYVAVASCICHAIWLKNLLKELGMSQEELTKIFVDN